MQIMETKIYHIVEEINFFGLYKKL